MSRNRRSDFDPPPKPKHVHLYLYTEGKGWVCQALGCGGVSVARPVGIARGDYIVTPTNVVLAERGNE